MNYDFTDRLRKVLAMAREEAIHLQHDHVGTVHILLGLIREGEGVAAAVLTNLNVDLDQIHERVKESVRKGDVTITLDELPYTSRAKKALEFAMAEAQDFSHSYVGTEHVLLGLVREGERELFTGELLERGIAAQVFGSFDVTLDRARAETAAVVDIDRPVGSRERVSLAQTSAAGAAQRIGAEPLQIWVSPGHATADDLADVHAAVSDVYRASGSGGTPVPDADTLSEARDTLVATIERLRQKGGNLKLVRL